MKRLMTTLIFVLLGWTGLCLADGVTVSGTVTLKETQWGGDITSSIMQMGYQSGSIELLQNGTGRYSGTMADDAEDPWTTRYSFSGVAAGNYTLSFNITFRGVGFFYTKDITVGETDVTENIEARKDNRGAMQLTIKYGEWDGENWTNERPIANAAVTCTQTDIEGATPLSGTSDASGEVQFLLAKDASLKYSFNVKADGYQDTTFTMAAFLENSMVADGVEANNTTVYMREKTLDFVTLSGNITMAPEGATFPAGIQIQLETVRHQFRYATPTGSTYSFEGIPVGASTISLYDPNNIAMAGQVDNYTITVPENGAFTVTGDNETFTQNITVTKVAAIVSGTIKDAAALNPQPTVTLTKTGETTAAYQATAKDGAFSINGVKAGTYTVGVTLAGYQLKGETPVTVEASLADVKLETPLELEAVDMEITFKAMLGVGSGNNYIPFNGAIVKLFAKGADVATATPLATATADAVGQFTLKTTGKLGTEYILYVTHEKIKPCTLEVTATKPTMTGNDLDFQFELAPVAIPTPTFTPNRGNVKPGATIAFTLPESLDIETTYNDMAFILYVENNATVELKSDVATLMNAIAGGIGGEPMAEGAEGDETEPSATLPFKVGMYREGEWAIPVSLSADASGAVVLRAVLAVSEDMETLLYSNEMTATYTVEGEAVKPTAPTFYVDGEAVEAAAAEIAADAVVTLQNGYEEDEAEARLNPIYYKLNGTDADFEISDATVLTAEGFDALTIYNAGSEIAIDEDMTIKAATAHIDAIAKTVTWSDITTVAFTVEEEGGEDPTGPELPETVAKPTFSVAAGPVDKGTKLTWTWDEAYDEYPMVGVVYVANGKDEDLNITADDFEGLYEELAEIEEGSAREDGKVYLYMSEEEGICTITKDMTVKARLAVLVYDENNEEVEIKMALSPVETVAYTIKGGTTEPEKDTVATPTFNPAAGEVDKGTKVEIACATDSVKIYYTVDGSEPTAASTEYTAAIEINEAMTIKAIAIKGETKSAVATAAYTVKVANEELALAGVSVYPNPSDGEFQLDLPVAATVEVFASTGVLRQRVEAGAGVMTLNIDRSGIYFLRITADGRTAVKRVVVR